MKCPKCNFISFDYNQACPKCGNDLSHERDLMNFPSFKPRPLSLLGVLTGDAEVPAIETRIRPSAASAEDAEELLISLNSLSDAAPEPLRFDHIPPLEGPEAPAAGEADQVEDELTISLDELSDESPELMSFRSEEEVSSPEMEIENEIFFEPERAISEEEELEKGNFWESEAMEPTKSDRQPENPFPAESVTWDKEEEVPVKAEEDEPDFFELEIEPLELDMEIEETDKKIS